MTTVLRALYMFKTIMMVELVRMDENRNITCYEDADDQPTKTRSVSVRLKGQMLKTDPTNRTTPTLLRLPAYFYYIKTRRNVAFLLDLLSGSTTKVQIQALDYQNLKLYRRYNAVLLLTGILGLSCLSTSIFMQENQALSQS